jgi:hypothetical protein
MASRPWARAQGTFPNSHSLTELGQAKYRALDEKQAEWVNELVAGLSHAELETASRVLDELSRRLEAARGTSQDHEGVHE